MPTITTHDGCPINIEVDGRDGAPVLMLSNSLGTNLHMWDDQAPDFAKHFRLVRWDRRGHGKSGTTKGPYNFDLFGKDILKIMDALTINKMNWCGLSMGGMARRQRARPHQEDGAGQHQFLLRRQVAVDGSHQDRVRAWPGAHRRHEHATLV